ncbi:MULTISPECIES: hypothetical protein [Amycolatopsis]|uniref:Uncharacterized protein n=1 Tax=Amycolatopsis thermalba TaxID=944492 RepID=A0ABY4NUA3_9PSEU|nr:MULTISPECIES: hypothetical protein [Amycolatopsis]OXM72842.1 hypothetical protein CF166_12555 [Amycolatopsis sp. KNN50.9b]UQS23625.1 hypothetical protein L1857_12705 [Amycolatopsis thermalba]
MSPVRSVLLRGTGLPVLADPLTGEVNHQLVRSMLVAPIVALPGQWLVPPPAGRCLPPWAAVVGAVRRTGSW